MLVESGLVIAGEPGEENAQGEAKRYDRFRDRVMFPIRNIKGECIGFGGRVLSDEKPKYLNSPETPVFSKGRELYGLFEARTALREHGYALVTEGYMDVVALAQHGFANAVATLGTACTHDHVQKLFRFTDSVVFSFDGDGAGRRAARKALDAALPFATDVRTVKFLFLPAEHDPDSYIRELGQEGFAAYVSKAVPLSRFMIEAAGEGCDLDTAEGRAHMASNARPLWTLLPDGALKKQLLAEIAEKSQVDLRDLIDLWQPGKYRYKNNSASRSPAKGQRPDSPVKTAHSGGFSPADAYFAADHGVDYSNLETAGYGGYPGSPASDSRPKRRVAGRKQPFTSEDRLLRLMLTDIGTWDRLTGEEHALLCALPSPHGPLFVWVESQMHEHGAQPWAALREGLRGHSNENYAVAKVSELIDIECNWDQAREILDQFVDLAWRKELKELGNAGAEILTDPVKRRRFEDLSARARKQTSYN